MNGIPLTKAAKELRIHPSTLRRLIRQKDCPVVQLGSVGRGKGSLVDLEAVKAWRLGPKVRDGQRQRTDAEILSLVVRSLVDTIHEDSAHRRVEVEIGQASGLLALVYQRIWRNLMLRTIDEYHHPPEIEQLCAIWLRSIEDR